VELHQIKNNCLFLDRDGVINKRPGNGYVTRWEDFHFMPGVLEALKIFRSYFKRIFVVTNQQGIGKGLMTIEDFKRINSAMLDAVEKQGGHIDAVYYCPDLASKKDSCRKPGIEMAQQAKNQFPEIDFQKSIMAGDTETDMIFGKNAGMTTVLIGNSHQQVNKTLINFHFHSLFDFANHLSAND
jgi:histidinol-phosphate phosphatase family protein